MKKCKFMEYVVVNVKIPVHCVDYSREGETTAEMLARAEDRRARDIARLEEILAGPYASEYFQSELTEEREKEFVIATDAEFEEMRREYYISLPLHEVTEERFDEMYNVLPPLFTSSDNSVFSFFVREMEYGSWTQQYARCGDKFYCKIVDVYDKTTWIHNFLIKEGMENV